jgi:peptidoglycan/xylan/chitin deacetylase (PgdA/CDA1 family)
MCACTTTTPHYQTNSSATTPTSTLDRTFIVPILMYHHVEDLPANADEIMRTWTVSTAAFTAQMDWLVHHEYTTIRLDQLVAALTVGTPLPRNPVVLTFDDGWDIGYGTVFPLLRERHMIGTFFVYPGAIGESPGSGYMTWPQLREMVAGGMDVQSHTISHPHMRGIPPEAQRHEITESRRILAENLDHQIYAFAYPFGEFDDSLITMVRDAGYTCAVGIEPGYTQQASDLFTLRRTRISWGDTIDTFKEQVTHP